MSTTIQPSAEAIIKKARTGRDLDTVALKFDEDKPRVDLIPPRTLLEVGEVFGHGALKYRPYNYLYGGGMAYSRLLGAAMRHTLAIMRGEDIDPESGKSHAAHAICSLMMLRETQIYGLGEDDRIHNFHKEDQ